MLQRSAPSLPLSLAQRAVAVATADDSTIVAWKLVQPAIASGQIQLAKYDSTGNVASNLKSVLPIAADPPPEQPRLAVDESTGQVIVTWWQGDPAAVYFRRYSSDLTELDSVPQRVNQPPAAPAGAGVAFHATVATDQNSQFLVTGQANVNDPARVDPVWNAFARLFDANGPGVANDFRVNVARSFTPAEDPRVARGPGAGRFVLAWRDYHLGVDGVFARVVEMPQ